MGETLYKTDDLEKQFPDEWVAVEVVERDKDGIPVLVKLLFHDPEEDKVFESVQNMPSVTLFYTGDVYPEGKGYVL